MTSYAKTGVLEQTIHHFQTQMMQIYFQTEEQKTKERK